MDDNPYQAPTSAPSPVIGVRSGTREDLKSVAQYQKGILVCILIYLICLMAQIGIPEEVLAAFSGGSVLAIGVLFVGLVGTVFVFLLALKVYSPGLGVLLGILALVPCMNLLVLLVVNARATQTLRDNGIRVGLLGADLSKL